MDKLHERKINDSYKSPNGKCSNNSKKFELVECRNSGKIDGKSMNVPNRNIRCIDSLDLLRNLISLKVQNNENSMEKYVR